ncbi:MAG: DUF6580 family putative transport protein [Patescibacteria group bacterium]|jgi:hypothetical protein
MSKQTKIILVISIVALAALSRLVEHPYNFTPIAAMALFSGCYLKEKWGILLPLAAMLASDYFLGFYDWQVMLAVYGSFAAVFALGRILSKHKRWYNVVFASLASSIVFFAVTNFAVWAFFSWYAHTWEGLALCFTLALPFFRNTLAGDLTYAVVLFGAYELVLALSAVGARSRKISQKIMQK